VVWAYNNGTDFDVAYSRWNGVGWTPTEILASSVLDEVDPSIHVAGGSLRVVWWVEQTRAVWLLSQTRSGAWGVPERVNGLSGMRPSAVTWEGAVLVASEADDGQGGRQILLSTRLGQDLFDTESLASTPEDRPLDIELHVEQGKLWMDWKHSSSEFAYSEFDDGEWDPTSTLPWAEHSWVAVEEMRLAVRNLVVKSP
jgi:hypothetical protein